MRWIGMIALMLLVGCVPRTLADYEMPLTSVQRPSDAAERWGEYEIEPTDSAGYSYEDEMVSLVVVPTSGVFYLDIQNKTDYSIRLLWDEMAYVGPGGIASGVESGDTRWIDVGRSTTAEVVPSGARVVVMALPEENANTSSRTISDFFTLGMSCDQVSDEVRLVVPLEIQGTTNEYTLRFEPENVWVRRESGAGDVLNELDCRS